ncbi:hypothetical protein [Nocardioides plantarum]|uniref:hypothetical protein n=1 Tax=Nocardioides plantarum TaxID=29299 RepID=UPI001B86650E|nr:hypothetical protein [Nocardioides plantarum]
MFAAYDHAVRGGDVRGLVVVADEGHTAIPLYLSIGFRVLERQLRAFAPEAADTGRDVP